MIPEFIDFVEGESQLDWLELANAIEAGHLMPPAETGNTFLYREPDTMISLSAWIDGLGIAVKSATVFPNNSNVGKPNVNGGVCLYSDDTGILQAVIDFHLVTKWKTAADSLLAALKLARPGSRAFLIVGAGTVARSIIEAYRAGFSDARFTIWNRTPARAEQLASDFPGTKIATSLEDAVQMADVVSCATMSTDPLIKGVWLRPGQHVDLIGAYRADMREADDEALQRARVFVDGRAMTMENMGDLAIPLSSGAIARDDVLADFYDLASGGFARQSEDDITLFKNGGGAHLDLMTASYILEAWRKGRGTRRLRSSLDTLT